MLSARRHAGISARRGPRTAARNKTVLQPITAVNVAAGAWPQASMHSHGVRSIRADFCRGASFDSQDPAGPS